MLGPARNQRLLRRLPRAGSWTRVWVPATVVRDAAKRTLTVQWDTRCGTRTSRVTAVQAGATPTLTVTELLAVADTLPSRG